MKAGNLILTHLRLPCWLAIRLPSPPFYLCIRSSSSSSISSPSRAPEGGVRIGNAKRLPPCVASVSLECQEACPPCRIARGQSGSEVDAQSGSDEQRPSVPDGPEGGRRSAGRARLIKGPLELAGHGRLASERARDACARVTRTRLQPAVASNARFTAASSTRCEVGRTRTDQARWRRAMRRLIRGQRSPWEEGREGGKGDRSLVVWWSTTPLASGAPLGE